MLLVLDRTNWKLGQQDINILLLSVRWQTFNFPLVWTLLPHSGNSNMATRIALVERLLPLLQGKTSSWPPTGSSSVGSGSWPCAAWAFLP